MTFLLFLVGTDPSLECEEQGNEKLEEQLLLSLWQPPFSWAVSSSKEEISSPFTWEGGGRTLSPNYGDSFHLLGRMLLAHLFLVFLPNNWYLGAAIPDPESGMLSRLRRTYWRTLVAESSFPAKAKRIIQVAHAFIETMPVNLLRKSAWEWASEEQRNEKPW